MGEMQIGIIMYKHVSLVEYRNTLFLCIKLQEFQMTYEKTFIQTHYVLKVDIKYIKYYVQIDISINFL